MRSAFSANIKERRDCSTALFDLADPLPGPVTDRLGKLAGKDVEFIYRDEGGPNPANTRTLAQELVIKDKVDYLGGVVFSPNAFAVAPVIQESKTPFVVFNAATSDITTKSDYYVRTSYTLWQVTVPLAQHAAKKGIKKVVTAVTDYAPGVDAENAFKAEFAKQGGEVVESIRMPIRTTDFAPFAQRIKASGAQAVYVFLPGGPPNLGFVKAYNENGLKAAGMTLAVETSYKRGATDFASQMQKLQASQCDMVVLGTIIRETIGGIATAKRLGFNPTFIGSSAAYTDLIHKLGGPGMNGFYAAMSVQNPYTDEASQPIRFWANKYKTKFNEDPTVFSVYGYSAIDAFLRAAGKAGSNLNTDSFIKAMDGMTIPPDIFGSAEMTFTATKRLGSNASRLSQIQDGRWKVISEYVKIDTTAK